LPTCRREARIQQLLDWALEVGVNPAEEDAYETLYNYARDVFLASRATAKDYAELVLRTLKARVTGRFD
jgi:hypothetical protein